VERPTKGRYMQNRREKEWAQIQHTVHGRRGEKMEEACHKMTSPGGNVNG